MERTLASVRKINEIKPIEGADLIELAIIDGWQVVTQKSNNFKPGDLVVYFEIDSLLPIIPKFEFLRPSSYVSAAHSAEGEGFRIKTRKLRGEISQGLILPISEIYDLIQDYNVDLHEGYDLTHILNVKKYERVVPANFQGTATGFFPSFIPKTDAERVQNCFKKVCKDHEFEVTEKLDGTSFTFFRTNDDVGVCSRNYQLEFDETNIYWQIALRYDLPVKLRELNYNIAIQGEIIGNGIQGNKYKLSDRKLYVFNIYDIDNQCYLDLNDRYRICEELDLLHAPVITRHFKIAPDSTVNDILAYAEIKSRLNPEVEAEGIVFKSTKSPNHQFKAISNKWLLKYGE